MSRVIKSFVKLLTRHGDRLLRDIAEDKIQLDS